MTTHRRAHNIAALSKKQSLTGKIKLFGAENNYFHIIQTHINRQALKLNREHTNKQRERTYCLIL